MEGRQGRQVGRFGQVNKTYFWQDTKIITPNKLLHHQRQRQSTCYVLTVTGMVRSLLVYIRQLAP